MNIFINAISISEGGGLVVLKQLLLAMHNLLPYARWYIASSPHTLALLPTKNTFTFLPYTWTTKTPLHLLFWYEIILPKLLRETESNVLFSQTNFLPMRSLPCPSLLLIHHAGYFSKTFKQLNESYYNNKIKNFLFVKKTKWAEKSIKRANTVIVQTNALAKNIYKQVNHQLKEKILVIPHGIGILDCSSNCSREFPNTNIWRIGYVTKFGVQKDFNTAFEAISLLRNKGIFIKLILTLDPKTKEFNSVWKKIKQLGIEDSTGLLSHHE